MNKDQITTPLMNVWDQFALYVPDIAGALLLLILGLLAASLFAKASRALIEKLKVDQFLSRIEIFRKAQEAGWKIRPSYLVGWIVKWFFVIVTLLAVSDKLGLGAIADFLNDILNFIPQVVVATVLLTIGFVVAQFVYDLVKQSMKSANVGSDAEKYVPLVSKWVIIVFAAMTAATQLEIAKELINIFFTGVVAAISIACGLAFGLGGKEHASRVLDRFTNK